jgi:hypothetical protein
MTENQVDDTARLLREREARSLTLLLGVDHPISGPRRVSSQIRSHPTALCAIPNAIAADGLSCSRLYIVGPRLLECVGRRP